MPRVSLVGDGHGGSEDYATIALWWAAESGLDYGSQIEAQCLGSCGDNYAITGASVNGAVAYTLGVTYLGEPSVRATLATTTRIMLNGGLSLRDIHIAGSNSFAPALSIGAGWDSSTLDRVFLEHGSSPGNVDCVVTTGATPNSHIRNVEVDATGCVNAFDMGFNLALMLENITEFGATGDGLEGSGTGQVAIDSFCFNNGANDYAGGALSKTNCASEDTTGNLTGYTSAELVDFAGGDYRTKATSFLATAGTGGSFVGAFLEVSSGVTVTVTETLNSFVESSVINIDYNVNLNVTETLNPFADTSVLSITSGNVLLADVTETLNAFSDSSAINISANIDATVTEVLNSFLDGSNVTIAKDITVHVTEVLASFIDNSALRLPANWVDKPAAITSYTVKTPASTIWIDKG